MTHPDFGGVGVWVFRFRDVGFRVCFSCTSIYSLRKKRLILLGGLEKAEGKLAEVTQRSESSLVVAIFPC